MKTLSTESTGLAAVATIRTHFPALARKHNGHTVAYFDGPGGTQIPKPVVEAIADYLYNHNANTHWNYPTSAETDGIITHAREAMADFFNASPDEISFGNNMTTIAFHVARSIGRKLGPGDEIVITDLDHHANIAPWRAVAKERGVTIRCAPFDPKIGELNWPELVKLINPKTKVVAIGAASNALGTISNVREAARLAHEHGALCFVDAVHLAAHQLIDVKEFDCDFLACSPYKFYGPHTGVLYARASVFKSLDVPKLEPAPDTIPDRIETGTQNHEGIAGIGAAVEFLASLSPGQTRREKIVRTMSGLHERGNILAAKLWNGLNAIKGVQTFGPPPGRPRTPTVSFSMEGFTPTEMAKLLVQEGLFASNGNFYAKTVMEQLGQSRNGLLRIGCACYTNDEELDRLLGSLARMAKSK